MLRKEKETNKEYVLRIIEAHPFAISLDEIRATMSRQRKNRNLVAKNSGSLNVTLSNLLKTGEIENVSSEGAYKYQIVRQEATEEETENEPEEAVETSPTAMLIGAANLVTHLRMNIHEIVKSQFIRNQEMKNRLLAFLEGRASLNVILSVISMLDEDSMNTPFSEEGSEKNE